jgi:hypothetical protein
MRREWELRVHSRALSLLQERKAASRFHLHPSLGAGALESSREGNGLDGESKDACHTATEAQVPLSGPALLWPVTLKT